MDTVLIAVLLVLVAVLGLLIYVTRSSWPSRSVGSAPDSGSLTAAERLSLENDRRRLLFEIGTVAIALVAVVVTFGQLQSTRSELVVTRDTQRQERFVAAVEQLGADDRVVQIAGIYGMRAIAIVDPTFRSVVDRTLAAYVRLRAACAPAKPCVPRSEGADPHIQVALSVLGEPGPDDGVIDLSDSNLSALNLRNADLSDYRLARSNLSFTDISGADLSGADLRLTRQEGIVGRASARADERTRWR